MTNTKQTTVAPEQFVLHRRIGSTNYRARVFYNPDAKETLEEKVRRLLKNDLHSAPGGAKLELLQAGWLPERGSL